MNGKYSETVAMAIDMIWKSYDKELMLRGRAMLEKAAESDPDAMCYLARCLMGEEYVWCGAGFEVDEDRAADLLRESARRGSASGVLCCLRNGNLTPGVRRDMPFASLRDAFDEVRAQAEAGDAFCLYMIGNVFFWGDWLLMDESLKVSSVEEYNEFAYPVARDFYECSFRAGLSAAFGNYRTIYESGVADVDDDTYEEYFRMLADAGDPLVANDYGKWLEDEYDDGEGALHYAMLALERGDLQSAYNVGTFYGRGYGTEQDLDKAFEYYKIAAEAGSASAQFHVGNFYFEGRGNVCRDYAQAVQWLERAYENPDADSESLWRPAAELAVCCQNGLGTFRDDVRAFEYLEEVEPVVDDVWEPLDAMVLCALGVAYAYGRGTRQDIDRGVDYLARAADFGSEDAAVHLTHFRKNIFGRWKQV